MNPSPAVPATPSPFPGETPTEPTYYAYVVNLEGSQRPGEVDVLNESHAWVDAVRSCGEFCAFADNTETNLGRGTTAGRGAVHLFYHLQSTVPCAVSVETYTYRVGITARPDVLDFIRSGKPLPTSD